MIKMLIAIIIAGVLYLYLSYDEDAGQSQSQTQSQTQSQPQTQSQAPRAADIRSTLDAAAAMKGVVIKSFSQTGKEARVRVEWGGDVATLGGDFMEVLFRDKNIRDVENAGQNVYYDRQKRRVWSQEFLLKLR